MYGAFELWMRAVGTLVVVLFAASFIVAAATSATVTPVGLLMVLAIVLGIAGVLIGALWSTL